MKLEIVANSIHQALAHLNTDFTIHMEAEVDDIRTLFTIAQLKPRKFMLVEQTKTRVWVNETNIEIPIYIFTISEITRLEKINFDRLLQKVRGTKYQVDHIEERLLKVNFFKFEKTFLNVVMLPFNFGELPSYIKTYLNTCLLNTSDLKIVIVEIRSKNGEIEKSISEEIISIEAINIDGLNKDDLIIYDNKTFNKIPFVETKDL